MTIENQPSGYNAYGCADELVYLVSDVTNVSGAKYRYIAQVFVDGTEVAKLKVLPNGSNVGVFNIAPVLRDYIRPTDSFNTTNFTYDLGGARSVYVAFGYEVAPTENQVPAETLAEATSATLQVTSGSYQRWLSDYGVLFVDTFDVGVGSGLSPFLSKHNDEGSRVIDVTEDDWGTLTTFRPDTTTAYDLAIQFFDAAGNIIDYQGQLYGVILDAGNELTGNGIAHLGVYPANLRNHTNPLLNAHINPDDYTGWASYRLFHLTAGGETLMTFKRREACGERTRFAWYNSLGTWDFINFYGRQRVSDSVMRKTYRTYGGNAYTAATGYTNSPSDGMASGGQHMAVRSVRVNSDFMTDALNPAVRDLFHSPLVYVQEDDTWMPVRLKPETFVTKRRLTDGAYEYEFEFDYLKQLTHVG